MPEHRPDDQAVHLDAQGHGRLFDVLEDRRSRGRARHGHGLDGRHTTGCRPVQGPCRRPGPRVGNGMIEGGRYRAWRFVHPDVVFEETAPSGGMQVTPRGRIEMVEGDVSIHQSLLLLLSTSPGERVMRPDYGCSLRRLVFRPNADTTARSADRRPGRATHYVRRAGGRWEPRVEVLAVDAGRDPVNPERLVIALDYRVRATRRADTLVYPLDLAGEAR